MIISNRAAARWKARMVARSPVPLTLALLALAAAATADVAEKGATAPGAVAQAGDASGSDAGVLVRVNGEPLYAEDVASVLEEMHRGMSAGDRAGFNLDRMIFRLVNDTLLAQEARALGMAEDDSIQRKLQALRERMARERVEKEEIDDRVAIGEDQIRAAYDELFRAATLRVLTRKDREEAQAIRDQIDAGADLESLIAEQSQDQYALRGGLIKDLPRIDLPPEIASRVFTMRPGEVGGPVATSFGWTNFRVEAISPADPEQLERHRGAVEKVLRVDQVRALRLGLLDRLRESHPVLLHEEVYESITAKKLSDGRLVPEIQDPGAVVVEAGGRQISAAAFGQALAQRWSSIGNPEVAQGIKPILLDSLTVDELMTAEGIRRGYDRSAEVERAAKALETRLLVRRYLTEVISPRVEVTQEEMREYYEANLQQFRRPPLLYLSQLTVTTREEAERLAQLVREGTDFSWLARKHSTDRLREVGGIRGWVPANKEISGFREELANPNAGDLLGPKGGGQDWILIKVGAVEDQGIYPFDEVSGNVRGQLESRRLFELIDTYIRTLRERSEIWVDEEGISSLEIEVTPRPSSQAAPGHGSG